MLSQKWISLTAASLGLFLGSLDITVNVALPEMASSFEADQKTVQWIIIFYVGTTTSLQLTLGNAADTYGLKRFYISGLIIYTVAVTLIAFAPNISSLFIFRMVQALGNGLILASTPALVTVIFPSKDRGKAMGFMTCIATLGLIAGALMGGVLVDLYGWRSIFMMRVPIGIAILIFALHSTQQIPLQSKKSRFDFAGAFILTAGLASLILFLSLGGRMGWASLPNILLCFTSVGLLIWLVLRQKILSKHTIKPNLLKDRISITIMAITLITYLATFVNWFIMPFYVSEILGSSASTLGTLLMLMTLLGALSAPIGGWMSDKISPSIVISCGTLILLTGIFSFISLTQHSDVKELAVRLAVTGIGMGLFQAATYSAMMRRLPFGSLGTGSAMLALCRSLGTVTSVAILGSLWAKRLSFNMLVINNDIEAFMTSFVNIYTLAGVLMTVAVLVSFSIWPRFTKKEFTL